MSNKSIDKKTTIKLVVLSIILLMAGYKFLMPKFATAAFTPATEHSSTGSNTYTSDSAATEAILPPPPAVVRTQTSIIEDNTNTKKLLQFSSQKMLNDFERNTLKSEKALEDARFDLEGKAKQTSAVNDPASPGKIVSSEDYSTPIEDSPVNTANSEKFVEEVIEEAKTEPASPSLLDSILLHGIVTVNNEATALISVENGTVLPLTANGKIANRVIVEEMTNSFLRLRDGDFVRTLRTPNGGK